MAKEPNVIPFQEGAPADNLEVEEIENDTVTLSFNGESRTLR